MTIITAVSGQPFKNDGGVALNMGDGSTSITNVAHGHTVKSSSYDTNSSFTLPNPSGVDPLGVQNDGMVVRKSTKTNIYNNANNFIFFGAYGSPLFSENKSYAELDAKDIHRSTDTEFSYFPAFTNRQAPLKRKQTIKLGELMMTSGEQLTQTPIEILDGGTIPFDENRLTLANEDCEGAEENEWIILDKGALGLPTMNINPPCGCYVNAGVGLLDLIPFGVVYKAIGKFATFFKYILNTKKAASGPWNTAITYVGGKLTEKMPFGDAVATTKGTFESALEWIQGWRTKLDNYKAKPNGDISNLPDIPTIETDIPEDLARVFPHPQKGNTYYTGVRYIDGQPVSELKDSGYSTTKIKSLYTGKINKFKLFMSKIRSIGEVVKKIQEYRSKKRIYLGAYPNATIPAPKVEIKLDPDFFGVNDIGQKYNHIGLPAFEHQLVPVAVDVEDTVRLHGVPNVTPDAIYFDKQTLEAYVTTVTNSISSQYSDYISAFFHDPGVTSEAWKLKFKAKYGKHIKTQISQKCDKIYQAQIKYHNTALKKELVNASKAIKEARQTLATGQENIGIIKKEIQADKEVVLEELKALANKDKIKATGSTVLNGSLSASWYVITGRAFYQVGRQKRCLGKNTFLNPETCNCECFVGYTECSADYTLNSMWGNIMWTWDTIVPLLPKTEEMTTCFESCCEGQVAYKSTISHSCGCACYGDLGLTQTALESGSADSHFKGASGCDCFSEGWMGFGKARGKCVSDSATALALGQGQAWDDARCEYNCAETRGLPAKKGASPDCPMRGIQNSYSALKENSVCECECAEPDGYVGTWPPTCPEGKIWDGAANVCACVEMGTACFKSAVLYSTNDSGPGTSFAGCNSEEHGCCNFIEVVVDAGEEYETTECWCPGEPDPVDDQGITTGECGSFNTQHNVACRTDMSLETAQAAVGQRFVHNGVTSYYLALHRYQQGISDCSTVVRDGKTYFNQCECYFGGESGDQTYGCI